MSNGNGSVAPHCPISHSQQPTNPHGHSAMRLPAIPIATDLPSLIRSVNIMRDILRNITTSLTINNTYLPRAPRQPKVYGDRTYNVSPYPDWYQVEIENESGFVGKDPKARAHVERLHKVVFRNNERDDDNLFKWLYKKPLTGRGGGNEPFEEDFFERLVKVKWKKETEETFSIWWMGLWWPLSEVHHSADPGARYPDPKPMEWGGLFEPYSPLRAMWEWKFHNMGGSPNATFSGSATGTSGSANEMFIPSIWFGRGADGSLIRYKEFRGVASATVQVIAQTPGEVDWYGWPPTPFGPINNATFGKAPSKYSGIHPGYSLGGQIYSPLSYDMAGSTTVSHNITARAADTGESLKLMPENSSISFSQWGCNVVAVFEREK